MCIYIHILMYRYICTYICTHIQTCDPQPEHQLGTAAICRQSKAPEVLRAGDSFGEEILLQNEKERPGFVYSTILFYTMLYHIVLHYNMLHYIILYYNTLHIDILYYIMEDSRNQGRFQKPCMICRILNFVSSQYLVLS